MNPIIKWTLWQRRFSTFWWSLGVSSFVLLNMVFYPSFKDDADELQKSFDNIPDTAVQLIGGSTDFFSPVGFLNSQIYFLMVPILLGILAISLGANLLAREEQEHTIDSVLARPISRSRFLFSKAASGIINLSIVTMVSLFVTIVISKVVDIEVPTLNIVAVTIVCFLLALSFGAVAFMLSALGRARVASLGLASLFAIGGYLISSLSGTVDLLKTPSKVFPFHYYESEALLRGTYDWTKIWFLIFVIGVCAIISWAAFRRRDIY